MSAPAYAGDISSAESWQILEQDAKAVLVDVRTVAEWDFVGVPELSELGKKPVFVCWQAYPEMNANPDFASELRAKGVGEDSTVLLLCRSGVRSRFAAIALTELGFSRCYNVADGF